MRQGLEALGTSSQVVGYGKSVCSYQVVIALDQHCVKGASFCMQVKKGRRLCVSTLHDLRLWLVNPICACSMFYTVLHVPYLRAFPL